jgi:hypothetical protein
VGEVLAHEFGGLFAVPRLDGVDDVNVLLAGPGQLSLVRQFPRALHPGLVAQLADRFAPSFCRRFLMRVLAGLVA